MEEICASFFFFSLKALLIAAAQLLGLRPEFTRQKHYITRFTHFFKATVSTRLLQDGVGVGKSERLTSGPAALTCGVLTWWKHSLGRPQLRKRRLPPSRAAALRLRLPHRSCTRAAHR